MNIIEFDNQLKKLVDNYLIANSDKDNCLENTHLLNLIGIMEFRKQTLIDFMSKGTKIFNERKNHVV